MSVEVVSGLKRKATFNIKKNDVQESVQIELKKVAKTAKLQGFRPGKAPLNLIEKAYGGKAYEDSLNQHINKRFGELVKEHNLDIADYPDFKLETSEGEEFIFNATFEVMPQVTIGDLTTIEIEKPQCELNDKNIENTIALLRTQRATYTADTNKVCANNDKVTIDFVGTIDGVPFEGGSAENLPFILGAGSMLPDFEAGILGKKVGETFAVNVNFPNDYHVDTLKNKLAIFNITIKNIEVQNLPELNEEFIKSIGVNQGTVDALNSEIKTNLNIELQRRLQLLLRNNAFNGLIKSTPIDVPHALVHNEVHFLMDNAKQNMKSRGYKDEQIKLTHDMFDAEAKKITTLRFLVQQIIKDQNITVSDAEVLAVVTDMAKMYDDQADYIKWYYTDENRVNSAKSNAMEKKVIDYLLTKFKVKETNVNYEELMKQAI
jgi:trigger factor